MIRRPSQVWDSDRFHAFKIRAHQRLEDAQSSADEYHILGNIFADEAAGRTCATELPDFLTLCNYVQKHYNIQQKHMTEVYKYLLDLSCERMTQLEQQEEKKYPGPDISTNHRDAGTDETQQDHPNLTHSFHKQIRSLRDWPIANNIFEMPEEPHRVVFWSCPWGSNYARLVWSFCSTLKWPAPDTAPIPNDPGISWTELSVSFMLWAGRMLPIRIKTGQGSEILEYHETKVTLQPVKSKSIRVLAENFRLILQHIQTFSRVKIIPAYKLQGTTSLTRLGFSRYHESGVSRHPGLLNAIETYRYMQDLVMTINHNPPFHNEIVPLPIPTRLDPPPWPNWPEIAMQKREKITQHVRCYMFRKKSFDEVTHPGPK